VEKDSHSAIMSQDFRFYDTTANHLTNVIGARQLSNYVLDLTTNFIDRTDISDDEQQRRIAILDVQKAKYVLGPSAYNPYSDVAKIHRNPMKLSKSQLYDDLSEARYVLYEVLDSEDRYIAWNRHYLAIANFAMAKLCQYEGERTLAFNRYNDGLDIAVNQMSLATPVKLRQRLHENNILDEVMQRAAKTAKAGSNEYNDIYTRNSLLDKAVKLQTGLPYVPTDFLRYQPLLSRQAKALLDANGKGTFQFSYTKPILESLDRYISQINFSNADRTVKVMESARVEAICAKLNRFRGNIPRSTAAFDKASWLYDLSSNYGQAATMKINQAQIHFNFNENSQFQESIGLASTYFHKYFMSGLAAPNVMGSYKWMLALNEYSQTRSSGDNLYIADLQEQFEPYFRHNGVKPMADIKYSKYN
jgi:hypothetical protein